MKKDLNSIKQEFQHLWDKLDLVVDGGTLGEDPKFKAGSTVIDLSKSGTFKIIRDGSHYENVIKILENDCKLERRTQIKNKRF